MAGAVGDEGDERISRSRNRSNAIQNAADQLGDVQVRALVAASEIIAFSGPAAVQQLQKPVDEIFDIEPVANVGSVAVNRKRDSFQRIEYGQWNELFGKLIRTVIVRGVADDHRQLISSVPGACQMVGPGLAGGIGRARLISRILSEPTLRAQRAEDLVGRDVNEAKPGAATGWQCFPISPRGFEQLIRADDIGVNECGRIADRPVDVSLRREVQHRIGLELPENTVHCRTLADIRALECVARMLGDCGERLEICRIGQLVDV